MTFTEALFSGKQYIRCPYLRYTYPAYCMFDTDVDTIAELTTYNLKEFTSSNWEVSDDNENWEV